MNSVLYKFEKKKEILAFFRYNSKPKMAFKATSFKNHGVINIFIFQPFVATVDSFSRVITKLLLIST